MHFNDTLRAAADRIARARANGSLQTATIETECRALATAADELRTAERLAAYEAEGDIIAALRSAAGRHSSRRALISRFRQGALESLIDAPAFDCKLLLHNAANNY